MDSSLPSIIEAMLVSEIGEFGLIRLLAAEFGIEYPPERGTPRPGLLVDLGDDAVVTRRRDASLIWTTDTLVAGVHFLPERSVWESVGWKALAVNLSDIAAMGGTPQLALVTLLLPEDHCVEDAVALYRGLREAADAYNVTLGGGDIVRSPVFAVTVALSGVAAVSLGEPRLLTRGAARPGDVVAVSGTLGDSGGGLLLLKDGAAFDSEEQRYLRDAHERPSPQVACGQAAVRLGLRCAVDISDGLVQDLGHIARASGVGIRIEVARLPLSDALRAAFPEQATGLALGGGEDYQLALIGPRPAIDALQRTGVCPLTEIGAVVAADEPGISVVDETGAEVPLGRAGWDHLNPS
jgi:thiamine-monophosphate kinase